MKTVPVDHASWQPWLWYFAAAQDWDVGGEAISRGEVFFFVFAQKCVHETIETMGMSWRFLVFWWGFSVGFLAWFFWIFGWPSWICYIQWHTVNGHLNTYTWNPKQPFINGCFNWMIPNLYVENDCFTKHPFVNGCLGFQAWINQGKFITLGCSVLGIHWQYGKTNIMSKTDLEKVFGGQGFVSFFLERAWKFLRISRLLMSRSCKSWGTQSFRLSFKLLFHIESRDN